MPFTPFHFGPGAGIKATLPGRFSLIIFCYSQVMIDLEPLYFLLRGAVDRFKFLQQGIAIVLIFIGLKMLVPLFVTGFHVPVTISLVVIVVCLGGSILYSIQASSQEEDRI